MKRGASSVSVASAGSKSGYVSRSLAAPKLTAGLGIGFDLNSSVFRVE